MARPQTPQTKEFQEQLAALRQLGGPFIIKVQRKRAYGIPEEIDTWEGVTPDELGMDISGKIFDNAGGGDFLISVFTPDKRLTPAHQFSLNIPGDPVVPLRFRVSPGGGMNPLSQSPWSSVAGMGAVPGPVWQNPYAYGFVPPFAAPALPVSGAADWENQAKMEAAGIRTRQDALAERMALQEEYDRRARQARQEAAEAQQQARMNDPLFLKMMGVGTVPQGPPPGPSPEVVQLQATVETLKASLLQERDTRSREESERRFREEMERTRTEGENRRREAAEQHQRELEKLRAEGVERDRRAEEERRRSEEERRRSEEAHKRDLDALKAAIEAKSKPEFSDELRRLEEKFFNTSDRQREADERRRIEDQSRRDAEALRSELAEARRAAEAKHTELVLAATKKDDPGMLTALGQIFGTTLKGTQDSSGQMLQAITAIMESSRKSGELPEWMGQILTKATSRGEEMAQVAQASGQIMSVALGAVGQVLQQVAGHQESPWVQIADAAFREIGGIGSALIQRGMGTPGLTPPTPGPDQPAISTTARELPAPADVRIDNLAAQPGNLVPPETSIPKDTAAVTDAKPVPPSAILATHIQQLKGSIRNNNLPAKVAAQAFVESVEFEAAYAGDLPKPVNEIGDDPRGVVEKLFGAWLRQFKGGDQYVQVMAEWVEKFVREGLPEDEEEEGEEEQEAHGDHRGATAPPAPPEARKPKEKAKPKANDHPRAPAIAVAKAATNGEGAGPEPEVVEAVPVDSVQ